MRNGKSRLAAHDSGGRAGPRDETNRYRDGDGMPQGPDEPEAADHGERHRSPYQSRIHAR